METTKVSVSAWIDKADVAYACECMCVCNGILFSHEKEGYPAICYNLDGPWKHYAKWNKSQKEICIVLLYVESKNTKKQVKFIGRVKNGYQGLEGAATRETLQKGTSLIKKEQILGLLGGSVVKHLTLDFRFRSWSCSLWDRAPHLSGWSLLGIFSLPLSLPLPHLHSLYLSFKINKYT